MASDFNGAVAEAFIPKNRLEASVIRFAVKAYLDKWEEYNEDPAVIPDIRAMLDRMVRALFFNEKG